MSESTYRINADEVSAKVIDGEAVVINLSSGVYYSLAGSGAMAWALLEAGHDRDAVTAALVRHYGIDEARAAADLDLLVTALLAESLLVPVDGEGAPRPLDLDIPEGGYEAPRLEKYADMADLLALDPPMPGIENIPWREPGA